MAESQNAPDNKTQEVQITSEEKLKIINTFHSDLKSIDLKKETIEKLSTYVQEQISKYGDQIIFELFQIAIYPPKTVRIDTVFYRNRGFWGFF